MPPTPTRTDDLDDPRLAVFRHLKAHNSTRDSGLFVVEGEKLFDRLLESPYPLASVLVSERCEPELAPRVPDDVPLFVAPHAVVEALVGFNFHRGILAAAHRRPAPSWGTVLGRIETRATLVVAPRVDNPENLGAMLRLADVFGAEAVVTGVRCPDPLSRRVLRVSMGTALRVPVVQPDDLCEALTRLRCDQGFRLAATVCDADAFSLDDYDPPARLAVLFGNEGNGLEPEWLDLCDDRLTIPMRPGAESLNLAVAAGIVLHHVTRPALRRP